MSDTPQGPDWWQASDGKWYPPQQQQQWAPQQPYQQPSKKGGVPKGCLIAGAIALLLGLGGCVAIVVLAGTAADDVADELEDSATNDTVQEIDEEGEADLFPGRPDKKENDKERNIGDSADLSGYTVTVDDARFEGSLSDFETEGYLLADVTIRNRDDEAQSFNVFEWKLITPAGTIIDPTFTTTEQLESGDLVQGGEVSGPVVFEVGDVKGDFFIIYDPSDFGDDRAVWRVTL